MTTQEEFEEREARLRKIYSIERENDKIIYEKKIVKISEQLNNALVNSSIYTPFNLEYYKNSNICNFNEYAIIQRNKLTFDKYVLGNQVYEVPKDKIVEINCAFVAYFDYTHSFRGFGTLTSRLNSLNTFHSSYHDACLGDNKEPARIIKADNPSSIIEAFKGLKETISIINPESYLRETLLPHLIPLKQYIDRQLKDFRIRNGDECENCENPIDECTCDRCSNCNRQTDDCECTYCNDCERYDDNCNCEFCEKCGNRINSRNYDTCTCEKTQTTETIN